MELFADHCHFVGNGPDFSGTIVGSDGFALFLGLYLSSSTPGSYLALQFNTSMPTGGGPSVAGAENRTAIMLLLHKSGDSPGYAGEQSTAAKGCESAIGWVYGGNGCCAHSFSRLCPAAFSLAGVTCGGDCNCTPALFSTRLKEFGKQSHLEYMLVSRGDVCVLNITAHREAGAPEGEDVSWGGFLVGVRGAVVSTDAALRPPRGLLLGERLERMETQGNAHHMPSLLV